MTSADAFQAYVRDFKDDLFTKLFYGFKTAKLVSVEEGVKGERILTNLTVANNLATRWHSTFGGKTDAVAFVPRTLKTMLAKSEFAFVPTEFEQNYLGYLRKKGQDPQDFPFEAYIVMKLRAKLAQEMENAVWQGTVPDPIANTDNLSQLFTGFLGLITAGISGSTITPVNTGALLAGNILQKFRDMWNGVDIAYREEGTAILCSYANYEKYRAAYIDDRHIQPSTKPIADTNYEGMEFEMGAGLTKIIPIPGMGNSNRVIITPLDNLVIGTDDAESLNFNVQDDHWERHIFGAFRLGVQFRSLESGLLVVNDQA